MTKAQQKTVDRLSKRIACAWYEKTTEEAERITDRTLNLVCVTEEMFRAIYPTFVAAKNHRISRDR